MLTSNPIKMVEAARDLLRNSGYYVDNLWHVRDIHFICEQHDLPPLTNDEAMEVFAMANAQFDGETGMCWPQLEKAIHAFLLRKALLEGLCNAQAA